MISKNNHIEFKGRTTQELDVGAAASFVVGAEFDLELGRTYTIDRPFFKSGIRFVISRLTSKVSQITPLLILAISLAYKLSFYVYRTIHSPS